MFLILLAFELQNNYGFETSGFKLHSFRAFQHYLTDKIQHMVEEQYQFFDSVNVVFERTSDNIAQFSI